MSDFKAKVHQIRFRLYSTPPDLLAGFQRPTSKGREGKGSGREGKRGEGRYKGSLLLREERGGERKGRGRGRDGKGEGRTPRYLLTDTKC